jgi:hypothetical protein
MYSALRETFCLLPLLMHIVIGVSLHLLDIKMHLKKSLFLNPLVQRLTMHVFPEATEQN